MGIVEQYLLQLKNEKRRLRRISAILVVLSLLVATGVSWNLRLTGITIANGTADKRIVFTSLADDRYCGDTNGDGAATKAEKGDWIEIDADGTVYLNGEKLDEPYAQQLAIGECDLEFPFQVPQEQYFVLGDMRETSIDSRNTLIGCVEKDQIVGKVFFRVWPFKTICFF